MSSTSHALHVPSQSVSDAWVLPKRGDARIPFAALLTLYGVLGFTFLGFNRSPWQMLAIVLSGCALDFAITRALTGRKVLPLSAWITCCSLALLLNYSHGTLLLLVPVALAIGSKHLLTFEGKHVFNPSMFGVAVSLLATHELVTAAPAYQWAGGAFAMSAFVLMSALALFVFRIGRGWLIGSFLVFYAAQTALRAYLLRHHLPPEVLFVGTLTSPPFFLFTFYMLTDPATSPKSRGGQIGLAAAVALVDLYLHTLENVYTLFYAALTVGTVKFAFLHARAIVRERVRWLRRAKRHAPRFAIVGGIGLSLAGVLRASAAPAVRFDPGFRLVAVRDHGLETEMSDLLTQVDPRVAHVAKWVLSVGDAAAVADVDLDGRVDLFLTNPLKRVEDRAALYLNRGGMKFERHPIPWLTERFADPKRHGAPAGAAFADHDGDGDPDLLLSVGFGPSLLLRNRMREDGALSFEDTGAIAEHTVSVAGTFLDYDRDAKLDLLVANALTTHLPDYDAPTPFNLFDLPEPEYDGDRRMLKFFHNGWHDADNGGVNHLWRATETGFELQDPAAIGMPETHWSISIATGDLNRDGWTDLYSATDFGRDDLYLNQGGKSFRRIMGKMFGDVGKDTYKGMNSTVADFDANGWLDVYVSDNHHALQAEGSLLWMTFPSGEFVPRFTDEATERGALNENRWGWGAAAGDLDLDGWVDLVQANGMVDDRLDRADPPLARKDYLYVNHKLMQSGPEVHTYADKWGDIRGRTIFPNEPRRVYLNLGSHGKPGRFVDVVDVVGGADPDDSRGVALADFDDDGDLDMAVTNMHGPVSLYRNDAPKRAWISLTLVGDGKTTSRSAIGSRIEIGTQVREVTAINGFSGANDPRVHFGLGDETGPANVTIHWLGGGTQTLRLEPNRHHEVRQ